jgi:hypothetical protein
MVELLERGGVGRGAGERISYVGDGWADRVGWGGVVGQLSLERPTVDDS